MKDNLNVSMFDSENILACVVSVYDRFGRLINQVDAARACQMVDSGFYAVLTTEDIFLV
jgi:hypothetical protein